MSSSGVPVNSILSMDPHIYSDPKKEPGGDLAVHPDDVCRLYVEGWDSNLDRLPTGFIPSKHPMRSLLTPPGKSIVNINNPYINFFMDSVQPTFQETVQPQKNVSQGFVTYIFGNEPSVINFSGVLANTYIDKWSEIFLSLYSCFLRASKLAELSLFNKGKHYQVVIRYQNKIMKGSIISLNKATTAVNEQAVRFNFQFLLKELSLKWEPPTATINSPLNSDNQTDNQTDTAANKKSPFNDSDNNTIKANPLVGESK